MNYQLVFIILLQSFSGSMQDEVCTLPDGKTQSTCMRLHHCDTIQNVLNSYGTQTPPQSVINYIRSHLTCNTKTNDICCPYEITIPTIKPATQDFIPGIIECYKPTVATTTTTKKVKLPRTGADKCILPNNTHESKCIRLHYCEHFMNILREHNNKLPNDAIENIKAHSCRPTGNYVCCPDNAKIVEVLGTSSTISTTKMMKILTDGVSRANSEKQNISTIIPPPLDIKMMTQLNQISKMNVSSVGISLPDILEKTNLTVLQDHSNIHLINEEFCGRSASSNRIIGGSNAQVFEFPWAALLRYDTEAGISWNCGGTLIARQFVLTAAHCIKRELTLVRLGEHTISKEVDCVNPDNCADPVQDIMIEKTFKHPDYKSIKKINDIALIKLKTAAVINDSVKTVCLPTTKETNLDSFKKVNNIFTIYGWGKIGSENIRTDVLQKAYVPYVEHDDCVRKFEGHQNIEIYKSYLCAGSQSKADACKGDSGGGLTGMTIVERTTKIRLYGIVSAGVACEKSEAFFPGIYTNIEYYLGWILDNMS